MSLAFRLSTRSAFPAESPRRRSTVAALRQAVHTAFAAAKRVYPAVLVLGTLGALFAAMLALRILIWVPLFQANH
jgi:hypothetical protein